MLATYDWNIFGRTEQAGIRCAIRQDRPVPTFIQGAAWEFVAAIRAGEPVPSWFRLQMARHSMRRLGYYLFLSL